MSQVDLSHDGYDLEESSAYEEVAIDGVDSPLPDSDPRSVLEVDPDAVLIDPGFLPPPPEPSDLIEKWVRSPDDRKPVPDTTLAPQRMAVMLLVTLDGQTGPCSGVMVGPDAVLTSAHCLFNPSTQRWATKVVVIPGAYPDPRNAARYKAPFGTSSGRKLFTPTDWRLGAGDVQKGHDYGVVRTNNASFVKRWRTVGYAQEPSGNVEYYGYQGDLARYQMDKTRGTIGRWLGDRANGNMEMKMSLYQGASGSAVSASGTSSIIGVMRSTSAKLNYAVFFNATKRDELRRWIAQVL